jgi:erythromycin esterase
VGAAEPGGPRRARDEIIAWVREHAIVIDTVDPEADADDLEPLRRSLADASVVGMGESVRGVRSSREHYQLKHRIARLLVERLGFRVIVFEDTPTVGRILDDYVRTGHGEPRHLLASAWEPWQTREFLDLLRWVRSFNATHPDELLRIVGVDEPSENALAWNTLRARREYGRRIVYWGGLAHVAVYRSADSAADISDGSVLRSELGSDYLALGLMCDHGDATGPQRLPPPPDRFAESLLSASGLERFALDLRATSVPVSVETWLTAPTRTRVIGPRYDPHHDGDYALTGGSLRSWLDVVVYVRRVRPVRQL